ncbi:COX15/CtaA family protein [Chitinibacteraceae bacterium HSL-7]
MVRRMLLVSVIWTLALIMLGAYVRLEDAGLGCPDWPGCYGRLTAPTHEHEVAHAEAHYGGDVDPARGWKEMIHRYVAGGLGLWLVLQAALLWRRRRTLSIPTWLVLAPLLVVIAQALLGMWTVTLKLMPVVVTAHLVGGMTLLAVLTAQWARASGPRRVPLPAGWRMLLWAAVAAVVAQIILGGWVSTNYAGLACNGFPECLGGWRMPEHDAAGFGLWRDLGVSVDGLPLTLNDLAAIHWLHRVGAMVVLCLVSVLSLRLLSQGVGSGIGLMLVLALQIGLGIANVVLGLPLVLAVAHNGCAALLLLMLVRVAVITQVGERSYGAYLRTAAGAAH